MKNVSSVIRLDKEFLAYLDTVKIQLRQQNPLPIVVNGLFGGAEDAFIRESVSDVWQLTGGAVLIIAENEEKIKKYKDSLSSLGIDALEYKERELMLHSVSASHDIERERLFVLNQIEKGERCVVLSTPRAALSYTVPASVLSSHSVNISLGDSFDLKNLSSFISEMGYTKVELCEAEGQFSLRGDILDLFPTGEEYPVRIEFFGDEVDRISRFDPLTQRSLDMQKSVLLLPAHELMFDSEARAASIKELDFLIAKAENAETKSALKLEREAFLAGLIPKSRDKFIPLCYKEKATLLSYLEIKSRATVIVSDINALKGEIARLREYEKNIKATLVRDGLVSEKNAEFYLPEKDYLEFSKRSLFVYLHSFSGGSIKSESLSGLFGFSTRKTVAYGENPSMLLEDVEAYRKSGYRVILMSENDKGIKSVSDTLFENGIVTSQLFENDGFDFENAPRGAVYTLKSESEGFELLAPKIAVLSLRRDEGRRIMENRRRQRILKKVGGAGERLMSYADLSVGDYVVHANYGIGLFEGMESVRVDGVTKDYITIRYAGTDKLFVPCERLEFIGKYIGAREKDGSVKLSKMGAQEWNRTKSRTKSAVSDIAKDLLRLYAERKSMKGYAFAHDSEMEDEFAAAFEYELTDSQKLAIDEIKRDMQDESPMNRLLCGDVGFGKTELALRAAFKAIMSGKQVALLVPTTILAMQHYRTALSRMRSYPVNIEMLSRFKTPKEQTQIINKLARGGIDLLIGTHKLLSKNIKFRDLGLLIVDEEQRFGVSQKEKLKELCQNVDVLTLTATPIPRTLNMAMNGISDMSILDEAPGDRKPVQTYVLEHNDDFIYEAIRKELSRGGQVLYLYNSIDTIGILADKIMREIPEARAAVAHGRMEKDELEDTWGMLVRGEIDVLICTTIIETGVDLPNANTLIIENADKMGLSQLHQLRGRVGRSRRQAYAYFTYRAGKTLTEIAAKRLSAIRDYAEFGAGFKVALRDLEIRGAGNLLGSEQHGYIDGVGYDLYVKMLSEEVARLQGNEPKPVLECTVDLKIDAHIPESYIPSSKGRMEMYKKISLIDTKEDRSEVEDELFDRYGAPPRETVNLLDVALCRALQRAAGVTRVAVRDSNLLLLSDAKPDLAIWSEVIARHTGLIIRNALKTDFTIRLSKNESALKKAIAILSDYYSVDTEKE